MGDAQERDAFMGADPGTSGSLAIIDEQGEVIDIIRFSETQVDVWQRLDIHRKRIRLAHLERVQAMPKQGVSSTFKFGTAYGFCQGLLIAGAIPFEFINPRAWQQRHRCLSGGNKNVTKSRAQELFPRVKVIHANADALLLAEHARRTALGLWAPEVGA